MEKEKILAELEKRDFVNENTFCIFHNKNLDLMVEEDLICKIINKEHHNNPVSESDKKELLAYLMVTPEQLYKYFKQNISKINKANFIKLIDRRYLKNEFNLS